jgi:peptide/nickel transport system ATP-binding protein
MYAGRIVEHADKESIFAAPEHPYTWGLLRSIPRLESPRGQELVPIPGRPPSLIMKPPGCAFHPRCPYVMDICKQENPPLRPISDDAEHLQACHLDEATKDREAQKLLAGTLAEVS